MENAQQQTGARGALLESTPAHRGLPDTNDSRPVSGLARVMNASPSHARGAQWRIDAVARLPLRGQRRTSTDFPFNLTRGGVRHLKRGGYDHSPPLKSRRVARVCRCGYDCMGAGGRAQQDARAESPSHRLCPRLAHRGRRFSGDCSSAGEAGWHCASAAKGGGRQACSSMRKSGNAVPATRRSSTRRITAASSLMPYHSPCG